MGKTTIKFFQALWGDSFLISFDNSERTTFLIDGGMRGIFRRNIVGVLEEEYKQKRNNYIFLTHIDADHIGGIQVLFENYKKLAGNINAVVFNTSDSLLTLVPGVEDVPSININDDDSGFTSYRQGKKLEQKLAEMSIKVYSNITSGKELCIDDIKVKFLSPSIASLSKYESWVEKEEIAYTGAGVTDYEVPIEELKDRPFKESENPTPTNTSSLAMLIEYKDKKMLFLGDALPSDVTTALSKLGYSKENMLCVGIVKISHHGSKYSTSDELLEMIECKRFLISTDGGRYGHPNKETLAKIIYSQQCPELIFNYGIYKKIFTEDELAGGLFTVNRLKEVIV